MSGAPGEIGGVRGLPGMIGRPRRGVQTGLHGEIGLHHRRGVRPALRRRELMKSGSAGATGGREAKGPTP